MTTTTNIPVLSDERLRELWRDMVRTKETDAVPLLRWIFDAIGYDECVRALIALKDSEAEKCLKWDGKQDQLQAIEMMHFALAKVVAAGGQP